MGTWGPEARTTGQLVAVLEKFSMSDDKESAMDFFAEPKLIYPMSCEAAKTVLEAFSFSDDKKSILRKQKPYITDAQNKLSLVVSFSMSDEQEEAEEILRDCCVTFEPPEPPEEDIQTALQAIGTCASGYAWVKQPVGYRCQAGGHYCSNEKIQAYLDGRQLVASYYP